MNPPSASNADPKKDLLSTEDLSEPELTNLFELTDRIRSKGPRDLLKGKTLGLFFQDPSLRTRVSFEVAMTQLGGTCIQLSAAQDVYELEAAANTVMDGSAEEHVKDAARTLSRYLDAIGVRASARGRDWASDRQDLLLSAYAQFASIPVINLQSNVYHPCQALADVFTMKGTLRGSSSLQGRTLSVVWVQSASSPSLGIPHSLVLLAARMGMNVNLTHPQGFELDGDVLDIAKNHAEANGGSIRTVHDPAEGIRGSDFVYARSWRSISCYGDPDRELLLKNGLDRWMITQDLLELGNAPWFMQPLPVRRNLSVTDEVLDGEHSLIYDLAENRLHVQKALLVQLLQ